MNNPSDIIRIRVIKCNEVYFSRYAMHVLGYPVNLNFWWGERDRVLTVSAADAIYSCTVFAPACFYRANRTPRIRNRQLIRAIKNMMGISADVNITVTGAYFHDHNMLVFRTADAEVY